MITARQALERYGSPIHETGMVLWDVPIALEIGVIPKRIYCNRDLVEPLGKAFYYLITRGLVGELKTWDGCFNIRAKRSGQSASLHSWGLAVDVNASWNAFRTTGTLSSGFIMCFREAGFAWGGDWEPPYTDPMHFELKSLPPK